MPINRKEMRWSPTGIKHRACKADSVSIISTCPALVVRYQQGMAVLGIVVILLSAITFVTISTSQQVQQFYSIEKAKWDAEQNHLTSMQKVKEIAKFLRINSASQTLNMVSTPDETTLIKQTDLMGDQQQPLQYFEVSISQDEEDTFYTAKFMRYPSLLRLPTSIQQFSWDNRLTEWLFNRKIDALSEAYFPQSAVKTDCVDLTPATIFWIEGDCQLENGDIAHSNESLPLMLLIVDGDLSLHADTHFHGLIVMLSTTAHSHTLHVAPSASIEGTYVSNTPLNANVYGSLTPSTTVLKTLQAHTALAKIIPVPGSWHSND